MVTIVMRILIIQAAPQGLKNKSYLIWERILKIISGRIMLNWW